MSNLFNLDRIVSSAQNAQQFMTTFNQISGQLRQLTGQQPNGETATTMQRTTNELTYAATSSTEQSLHGTFDKEYLKKVVQESPDCLEKVRQNDGCTPLLCAVKCNNLNAAVLLLSYGAKVDAADLSGNTALHHAVMAGSAQIVKLLLLFKANPNTKNKFGQMAFSLKTSHEVAEILSHVQMHQQNGVVIMENRKSRPANDLLNQIELSRQSEAIRRQKTKTPEEKAKSIRLLSMDGGGIRGLVLIQMLIELEELADREGNKKQAGKSFVQRNFDWIAGTSTGAILALALADGTTLVDCLRLYLRLKDEIFCRIRPYDSECIERFLKEQFGERKMNELRGGKRTRVLVTTTKADLIPIKLALLRSYRSPLNQGGAYFEPDKMPIWKAARCSSAAPTYFASMDGFMDGGLISNNPGPVLLLEVLRELKAKEHNLIATNYAYNGLAFLLSLGTGKSPEIPVTTVDVIAPSRDNILQSLTSAVSALTNLKSILIEQLASSDGLAVETSREMAHSQHAPYFRLTPLLEKDIQLDTVDNKLLIDMLWTTKIYIREECAQDVLTLVNLMKEFERSN